MVRWKRLAAYVLSWLTDRAIDEAERRLNGSAREPIAPADLELTDQERERLRRGR